MLGKKTRAINALTRRVAELESRSSEHRMLVVNELERAIHRRTYTATRDATTGDFVVKRTPPYGGRPEVIARSKTLKGLKRQLEPKLVTINFCEEI